MGKRSSIPKDRLALLKTTGAVYGITCFQTDYYCKSHNDGRCRRGFFSLFLQAIYGIQFANNMGLNYYVDFGNLEYSYSESWRFDGNKNFWEYYFEQPFNKPTGDIVYNSKFENFPLKVWDRPFIRQLHHTMISNLKIRSEIQVAIDAVKVRFNTGKILGVHVRKTDHYMEVEPVKDIVIFQMIDKKLGSFDKLFLATDDANVLGVFEKKYGNKLISNSFFRSCGKVAIHDNDDNSNGYELGKEALMDCFSLSFCDKVILSPSNLSYCALVLNPELPYEIAESREAKWQRWKTLGAYYLNKWGIRKW